MCKEIPVIPVDRVVDKNRIIGKMEGGGGGEARWVADQKRTIMLRNVGYAWRFSTLDRCYDFKNISAKKIGKKSAFLTQNKAK
jgi:hypothetical protein